MQSCNGLPTKIISEIGQKTISQKSFLLKILSSKRLLIDHVEVIEDLLKEVLDREQPTGNLLTFLTSLSSVASAYLIFVHFKENLRYLVPLGGVIPVLYVQKLVNTQSRKSLEAKLSKFIHELDNFESMIKKNKSFLQEAQMIKSLSNILKRYDRNNKMHKILLISIKNVINALYKFVKDLETYTLTEKLEMIYEPLEDIQDCDLMKMNLDDELDLKLVKDFFNIFAYVQSQVLLRLALITVSNIEDIKVILNVKINSITEFIRTEKSNISKFLDLIDVSQLQINIQQQIESEISITMPKELREVRSGSITFASKILTVGMHCQYLEELIVQFTEDFEHPNTKKIAEILDVMKTVENELSVSIDEHKRIAISFQKYLNMEIEEAEIPQEELDGTEGHSPTVKIVTEDDVIVQTDDFFFVDGTATEADEEPKEYKHENVEEVNMKLAKKYFKPVLAQLKERIEVIGEEMKEREKKVLQAKGIEIADEPELPTDCSNNDDGSGSDDEQERQRKFKRSQQKFSADREFLNSKQPINIFVGSFQPHLPVLLKGQGLDEDILE